MEGAVFQTTVLNSHLSPPKREVGTWFGPNSFAYLFVPFRIKKKRKKESWFVSMQSLRPGVTPRPPAVLIRLRRHLIRPCRLNRSRKGFGPFPPQACMEWNGKKQYLFEPLSAFKKCFRSIVSLFIYSASLGDLQVNQFVQLFFDGC